MCDTDAIGMIGEGRPARRKRSQNRASAMIRDQPCVSSGKAKQPVTIHRHSMMGQEDPCGSSEVSLTFGLQRSWCCALRKHLRNSAVTCQRHCILPSSPDMNTQLMFMLVQPEYHGQESRFWKFPNLKELTEFNSDVLASPYESPFHNTCERVSDV